MRTEIENTIAEIPNQSLINSSFAPLEKLQTITENLHKEDVSALCLLDNEGFIIGKDETLDNYKNRLSKIFNDIRDLNNELKDNNTFIVYGRLGIKSSDRIGQELCKEAVHIVSTKYSIEPSLIESFYAPKSFGLFVGGCAVTFDSGLSVILLKRKFKFKKKWLLYTSSELLAHELCHSARAPIMDNKLEEFFAYNISDSPLRKHLGNCFKSQWDSILILLPIFLLMTITIFKALVFPSINTVFFWVLILVYPAFLIIRNHFVMSKFYRAKDVLSLYLTKKDSIMPILFRSSFDEISTMAKIKSIHDFDSFIEGKTQAELRWKIIYSRFVKPIIE